MKAEGKRLKDFLESKTAFTSIMSTRLYPLVANEGTPFPFATYRILTTEGDTKDADKAIVALSLWYAADKYTECVTGCDAIEALIKQEFNWISSDVDFITEDQSFVANINFELT